MTHLLNDLQVPFTSPTSLYCDSQSTRHIASNPTFHESTKLIDIDRHIVWKKKQAKLFHLLSSQFCQPINRLLQQAP